MKRSEGLDRTVLLRHQARDLAAKAAELEKTAAAPTPGRLRREAEGQGLEGQIHQQNAATSDLQKLLAATKAELEKTAADLGREQKGHRPRRPRRSRWTRS
ncbi:MAG: hypothetical protein U1G05_01170 [Kiritimatiellia bacterium]